MIFDIYLRPQDIIFYSESVPERSKKHYPCHELVSFYNYGVPSLSVYY